MKKNKYVTIILIFFILVRFFVNFTYASNAWVKDDTDTIIKQGQDFITEGKLHDDIKTIDGKEFRKNVKTVFEILFIIGITASLIIISILGIRIMIGSAEEKAEVKEKMIPYIIGVIVIFSSYTIWKIVMLVIANIDSGNLGTGETYIT